MKRLSLGKRVKRNETVVGRRMKIVDRRPIESRICHTYRIDGLILVP
jgi:hypothetical protein